MNYLCAQVKYNREMYFKQSPVETSEFTAKISTYLYVLRPNYFLLQYRINYLHFHQSFCESSFTRKAHPPWDRPGSRPVFLRGQHSLCKEIRPGAQRRERHRTRTDRGE